MFGRVTTLQSDLDRLDERIRVYQEQTETEWCQLEGWQGAILLVDRTTGKSVSITFWDSARTLRASEPDAGGPQRPGANGATAAVEVYEVAVQV
jgi:hypothetical protein